MKRKRTFVADGCLLCREVQEIDRAARGETIYAPVMYALTGDPERDRLFVARVEQCGPGQMVEQLGPGSERLLKRIPPTVARGELLMMNLFNVSYRVHRGGRPHYVVRYQFVCATLDPETFHVKPLQHYVLVRDDDKRAMESQTGGLIWLVEDDSKTTDDVGRGQGIQAAYGVVEAVGPGAWHEGAWLQPRCAPGDLVLYDQSHSTLEVTIQGKKRTLVAGHQIVMVEKPTPEESRTVPRLIARGTATLGPRPTERDASNGHHPHHGGTQRSM